MPSDFFEKDHPEREEARTQQKALEKKLENSQKAMADFIKEYGSMSGGDLKENPSLLRRYKGLHRDITKTRIELLAIKKFLKAPISLQEAIENAREAVEKNVFKAIEKKQLGLEDYEDIDPDTGLKITLN